MTNKEIDEICCQFAKIEPNRRELCNCSYPKHEDGCSQPLEETYPPVSTDWGAAGRLMDALCVLGYRIDLEMDPTEPLEKRWQCNYASGPWNRINAYLVNASTGPMALALAVVALAENQTKEK